VANNWLVKLKLNLKNCIHITKDDTKRFHQKLIIVKMRNGNLKNIQPKEIEGLMKKWTSQGVYRIFEHVDLVLKIYPRPKEQG